MIDGPPTGGLAVYLFLEMIALGFALEAVAAFMHGDGWWKWLGALVLGVVFMVLGVKSEKILRKFSQLAESGILGRRIVYTLRALVLLASIAVAAVGYYEIRRLFPARSVEKTAHPQLTNSPNASSPLSAPTKVQGQPNNVPAGRRKLAQPSQQTGRETGGVKSPSVPTVAPIQRVDWHDKQNWRLHLHTGMTKEEVRQLFGEPEKMSVISDSEFWNYGRGEIQFDKDALWSWFEPE